jgi:glycosyltransferase involved in cell wall biosynthesis
MKPLLFAFSPYLRFKAGGEKYFLSILEIVQHHFDTRLIRDNQDLPHLYQLQKAFRMKLAAISMVTGNIRSQSDIQKMIPPDAVFFSVSNGRPLPIPCRLRILHHQVIYQNLTDRTVSERYAGQNKDQLNMEIRNDFRAQDKIFYSSKFILDFMVHHWRLEHSTSQVIHPPIADSFFTPVSSTNVNNIINVGRFEPIKQQLSQIELFKRLQPFLPDDCRLIIVGSKRTQLSEQFEQMVDHNRIHIKYGLSERQLKDEFASAAVFWSTNGLNQTDPYGENSQESFGLAIAESMAMGCVPVAVNAGGVSEIIQNDVNGYLVNSPDEMG